MNDKFSNFLRKKVVTNKKVLECLLFFSILALLLLMNGKVFAMTVSEPSPNPFNPGSGQVSTISFSVDNSQYVTVQVVNQFSSKNSESKTVTFTNVYGGSDAVTYHKEVIKAQIERIYAAREQVYSVSWDGTADKGNPYNLCQRGAYYFKVIPENSPQYTVYKYVNISQWNPDWLAYIRHARTWIGTNPYAAGGVSRDDTYGSDCTGFVMGVYREMSYPLYFPESDVSGMVNKLTTTDNPAKTKYLEKVGEGYNLIKQSNLLAWNHNGEYEHVTIATYETSDGWHIIHSNAQTNSVVEEIISSWYSWYFNSPTVLYWIDIGPGN